MNKEKRNLYDRARNTFGLEHQTRLAQEECAELIKEINKWFRYHDNAQHIAEEIADVEITLEQIKYNFMMEELVEQKKKEKIARMNELV